MRILLPAYTPYGHCHTETSLAPLLGFNGERSDPLTGTYALGQGFRSYSAVLMRFLRPDELSPFAEGGYNAYAYCAGDPLNYRDDTGQNRSFARVRQMWEDRSRQPVQQIAPPRNKPGSRLANTQQTTNHRAPRDRVQTKKNVSYNETTTIIEYVKEQKALKNDFALDKKSLKNYIQKLTEYKEQKFQDLVYLSNPETRNEAISLGVTKDRYKKEIKRFAKKVGELEDRLHHLNSTLRSYDD